MSCFVCSQKTKKIKCAYTENGRNPQTNKEYTPLEWIPLKKQVSQYHESTKKQDSFPVRNNNSKNACHEKKEDEEKEFDEFHSILLINSF
jgi:hypothetical protein